MKRIVIVEDETLLCELLAQMVEHFALGKLAGICTDGQAGWMLAQKVRPDMAVLDIKLPTLNGLEVLRRIRKHLPRCQVLVFSGCLTPDLVRQALQAGAHGIIEKTARLPEMEKALRAVLEGGTYLGQFVTELVRRMMTEPQQDSTLQRLSEREREVLQLVAEGYSTKEISSKLGIGIKTIQTHRTHLMTKLDRHNVAGLTRYAIDHDLLPSARINSAEGRVKFAPLFPMINRPEPLPVRQELAAHK